MINKLEKEKSINFNVEVYSLKKNLLKITLILNNFSNNNELIIYKNKIKLTNLKANCYFTEKDNFINLKPTENSIIEISYLASVGYPAKHGIYGCLTEDLLTFGGEQFLIFPTEVFNGISLDTKISINFNFENKDRFSNILIPFNKNNSVTLTDCNFGNIYELLKSPYNFSKLNSYVINNSFTLTTNKIIDSNLLVNLRTLYNYYCNLFKITIPIELSSISIDSQFKLFAGSSRSLITADFDFNDKRDWQLLSHRLFHSFMDSKLDNPLFHIPPNLWVTEGLASYYEHKALEILPNEFKEKLKISFNEEFKNLHRIYRYTLKKAPSLYGFPPMVEGELKIKALIEYLHYYKAPLLINFFEEESPLTSEDKFINYLINLDNLNKFSLPDMFYFILKDKINEFSINYIFNSAIIPSSLDLTGDLKDIKNTIENFEEMINSWFLLDNIKNPIIVDENLLKELF